MPVSSRVGQRYGRRTPSSYASSSDWWPGDILFLDWEARSRSTSSDGMRSVEEASHRLRVSRVSVDLEYALAGAPRDLLQLQWHFLGSVIAST